MTINKNKTMLDPELAFTIWYELGTLKKTQQELARRGIINEELKQPLSPVTIRRTAYIYLVNNPERVRILYELKNAVQAETQEKWDEYIIGHAIKVYKWGSKAMKEWARRRGYGDEQMKRVKFIKTGKVEKF